MTSDGRKRQSHYDSAAAYTPAYLLEIQITWRLQISVPSSCLRVVVTHHHPSCKSMNSLSGRQLSSGSQDYTDDERFSCQPEVSCTIDDVKSNNRRGAPLAFGLHDHPITAAVSAVETSVHQHTLD